MRCQACTTPMREERATVTLLGGGEYESIRQICPHTHCHGEFIGMPMQWRGPNAVRTMRAANAAGYGYERVIEDEVVTLPYPVES